VEGCDVVQYPEDFLLAQDAGQSSLSFGVQIVENMPVAFEHMKEEELDATVCNAHGGGGPFVDVSTVKEIIFQLQFADLVWSFAGKVHKLAHRTGIALLGAFAHTGKLQGSYGSLVIVFHHGNSPFSERCNWG
jgi:hypothetical protein